jgi:hypothetical protein
VSIHYNVKLAAAVRTALLKHSQPWGPEGRTGLLVVLPGTVRTHPRHVLGLCSFEDIQTGLSQCGALALRPHMAL